jgi:hypothetical protein
LKHGRRNSRISKVRRFHLEHSHTSDVKGRRILLLRTANRLGIRKILVGAEVVAYIFRLQRIHDHHIGRSSFTTTWHWCLDTETWVGLIYFLPILISTGVRNMALRRFLSNFKRNGMRALMVKSLRRSISSLHFVPSEEC